MRLPQLDGRLGEALALVPPCSLFADIGADHGLLAAAALTLNRAERVIVSDISQKALMKAKRRLIALSLADRCIFRVADGLDALVEPCEHVCVLGMGGDTIADMLLRGSDRLLGASMTLGAQTDHELVRRAVQKIGYHITAERVAQAGGRLYLLIQALPGETEPYTDIQMKLGPMLLESRDPLTLMWFSRQARYLSEAVTQMNLAVAPLDAEKSARLQEYTMLLEYIKHVTDQPRAKEDAP